MAEQKATAAFLLNKDAIDRYFAKFKAELQERMWRLYDGLMDLKQKGYAVDAITPQAAIYLTVKFDLRGKSFNGKMLETQGDVTEYILSEAKLAIVPFSAFGAGKQSPWYRISIGTCKKEEIDEMFAKLEGALQRLKA